MSNFKDGAPTTPGEYIDLGCDVTPCKDKRPILKDWQTIKADKDTFIGFKNNIGLKMTGLKDLDADNHYVKRFAGKYLLSPGSTFGRKSNPSSHYIYSGETKSYKYTMPKELEHYCKDFPHGVTLLEIRSGNTHQTIAPGSTINGEKVDWCHWVGFQEYVGNFDRDVGKIALSVALTIIYAAKGKRDAYCTAIAGVLKNHTDWSANEIDVFVYNLAYLSGKDDDATERMAKGTNAFNDKTRNYGFPKLAEVVGCSVSTLAKLFEWVGVKNASSLFGGLRVYNTEPKMWELQFKDKWIPIMDTSLLLSYTKIKIAILENCMEEPPELKPNDWKAVRMELLKNVQHIDTPPESSYYGVITGMIVEFLKKKREHQNESYDDKRFNLLDNIGCAYHDNYYWVKTEAVIRYLKNMGQSIDVRKIAHLFRNEFGAENTKITLQKKEIRCWKIPLENVEGSRADNTGTVTQFVEARNEWVKKKEERLGHSIYGKKDNY